MITQEDVDKAMEVAGPDYGAFGEAVRVQTQLMLEMRDTLGEISELQRNQLITLNSIWEKLHS